MTTQEITVRVSKTIQEQQYEPITAEVIITETCPKKKYGERIDELMGLASEKVFDYLEDDSSQPETEEGGAEEYEEDQGSEEGFEEEEQGAKEEALEEDPDAGEEALEEGNPDEDEFGDFFEDDPGEAD